MDRRTIFAFVLIGLLTIIYMWTLRPAPRPPTEPAPISSAAATTAKSEAESPAGSAAATTGEAAPPIVEPAQAVPLREDIRLQGDKLKYEMHWSNQGACLREARLTDYFQKRRSTEGVLLLQALDDSPATLALIDPTGALKLDSRNYEVIEDSATRLAFAATFSNGLRVIKEYAPEPGKYELKVKVRLKNTTDKPLDTQYAIVAAGRLKPEAGLSTEVHGAIGRRTSPESVSIDQKLPGSVSKEPFQPVNEPQRILVWAGAGNRYFAAILHPTPKSERGGVPLPGANSTLGFIASASVEYLPHCDELKGSTGRSALADNVIVKLVTEKRSLKPGEEISDDYTYFLGPKTQEVLAGYPDMAKLLDYGMFGFVSKLLLALLHGFYWLIPNYGVGIILMTLMVRLCLFPMTRKGQIAMQRMQKLQPLIKEMQEKHKDDRKRQGQEMMELYRKHNANPMSGCWPMLVQLPILWGLFQMLQNSIDLRQQPFLPWWVVDLSKPDTIAAIGGFPINILPVLMTISSIVQQMTMPKPVDPQQAQTQKMMMFMPVLICVMFYSMASGLTLYWLMSTLSGIIEQRLIKLHIKRMEARGAFAPVVIEEPANRSRTRPKHK